MTKGIGEGGAIPPVPPPPPPLYPPHPSKLATFSFGGNDNLKSTEAREQREAEKTTSALIRCMRTAHIRGINHEFSGEAYLARNSHLSIPLHHLPNLHVLLLPLVLTTTAATAIVSPPSSISTTLSRCTSARWCSRSSRATAFVHIMRPPIQKLVSHHRPNAQCIAVIWRFHFL
ncbi:hypothetical protein TcWFU_000817 [Taenia crassiceps]|uniref:Uncharacterized protein n=1 Tax=Taenia crassiceps TaxID=6207 RepID=A0ABR4QNJ1_9CEST